MKLRSRIIVKGDMRIFRALSVLAILATGCVSVRPVPAESFITVEKEAAANYWRATWHLSAPARELRFERRGGFRARVFEVVTPGYRIESEGGMEVLRTEGEAASTITVRFPEFTEAMQKEYYFFQKFTDGSVAIYTGHLVARPVAAGETGDCPSCYIRSFRFNAPPGSKPLVDGRMVPSPHDWRDPKGQGTYVYFGSIEPVVTSDMISIVDPGVPSWLQEETRSALPRLFALYRARFGVDLPQRPTILFNHADSGNSGYTSGGGTLPGQIQLTVDGAAWKTRSEPALLHLMHFLAHEAAHMWNGQVINYPGTEHPWMHEGGADALAERTMLELGLIDKKAFVDYQISALNGCRKRLDDFPLKEAAKRGNFFLYYSCGNAIALFTESVLDDGDLFTFWKKLIARVLKEGRATYEPDDYYAQLKESGADAADVDRLRTFVEEQARPEDLVTMLQSHGVRIVEEADPPQSFGQSIARDALLRLLTEHCRGPYGFNARKDGFLLGSDNDCGIIPPSAIVKAIGGQDALRSGHRTWEALEQRCGTDKPVEILVTKDGTERTIEVPCKNKVRGLPPYVRILM